MAVYRKLLVEAGGGIIHHNQQGDDILGVEKAEIPSRKIMAYLASELFNKFSGIYERLPSEQDLLKFIEDIQLSYEDIKAEVSKGVRFRIMTPPFAPGVHIAGLVTACDNWAANASRTFQENQKALTGSMEGDYHYSENPRSLAAKVYNALFMRYAANPEYGPFFAKGLLYSNTNKNLVNVIDGYLEKNSQLKTAEVRQREFRKQELDTAEEAFEKFSMFGLNRMCEKYIQAIERWYVHLTRIELYTVIENALIEFRRGVLELHHLFHVLTTVLETLKDTFKRNGILLTEHWDAVEKNNPNAQYIVSVPDIKADLDASIKELDINAALESFLAMMMRQYTGWITGDENEIARLVSDFMDMQFASITERITTDYFKYSGGNNENS